MMGGYLREVEKKHKLAGILCNIKDMGEGVKQNEHSKNHMVRRRYISCIVKATFRRL